MNFAVCLLYFLDPNIDMIEKRKDALSRLVLVAERIDYCYEKNVSYLYLCSDSVWMRKLQIRFLFQ